MGAIKASLFVAYLACMKLTDEHPFGVVIVPAVP